MCSAVLYVYMSIEMERSNVSGVFSVTDLTESHSLDSLMCRFLSFFLVIIFLFGKDPISAYDVSTVLHMTLFQFFFFYVCLHN